MKTGPDGRPLATFDLNLNKFCRQQSTKSSGSTAKLVTLTAQLLIGALFFPLSGKLVGGKYDKISSTRLIPQMKKFANQILIGHY